MGMSTGSPTTSTMVHFDADCGLCSASVRWLEDRSAGRIDFRPSTEITDPFLLAKSREALICHRSGRTIFGADAVIAILEDLDRPWPTLSAPLRTRFGRGVAMKVYALIAPRRARISRALGLNACRISEPVA
jgi:predicted DCC family thiol-disulfide oxidoreductase YuxK